MPWLVAVGIALGQIELGGATNQTMLIVVLLNCLLLLLSLSSNFRNVARGLPHPGAFIITALALTILWATISMVAGGSSLSARVWRLVDSRRVASVDISASLLGVVSLLGVGTCLATGYVTSAKRSGLTMLLVGLTISSGALSIAAIGFFKLAPLTNMGAGYKTLFLDRLTGPFISANVAGTYFGGSAILGTGLTIYYGKLAATRHPDDFSSNIIMLISILAASTMACIAALALTKSRSATFLTLTLLLALGAVELGQNILQSRRKIILLSVSTVTSALLTILFLISGLIDRMGTIFGDTRLRHHIYGAHIHLINGSPMFGYGLGSFDSLNRFIAGQTAQSYDDLWTAGSMHNALLQWAESGGYTSASLIFALIFALIGPVFTLVVISRGKSTLANCLFSVDLLVLLHSQVDFPLENPSIASWWSVVLGSGLALFAASWRRQSTLRFSTPLVVT